MIAAIVDPDGAGIEVDAASKAALADIIAVHKAAEDTIKARMREDKAVGLLTLREKEEETDAYTKESQTPQGA